MKLDISKLKSYRVNLWVVAAILVLAAVLGALNNFRVYEEQRVPWPWEAGEAADGDASGDSEGL